MIRQAWPMLKVFAMGSSASISAVQGIQAWTQAFDRSANTVTRATAELSSESTAQAGSPADLIDGMVGLHFAAAGVRANIAVFRTADEMMGTLLNMKA
jgi:hypothetical protein